MPVVNYPAPTAPPFPPPSFGGALFCADIKALLRVLREYGFTQSAPTAQEVSEYFNNTVRCDEGHQVTGRMLVAPENHGGLRYPFAVCNNAAHRQLLVPWGPDYCMGGKSGEE